MFKPEFLGLVRRLLILSVLIVCLDLCSASRGLSADSTFIQCDTTARNCGASCLVYLTLYNDMPSYLSCVYSCNSTFNYCVQSLDQPPVIELRDWCESKATGLYNSCNMDPSTLGTNTPNGQAYSACIANGGFQADCCGLVSNARRDACMPPEE